MSTAVPINPRASIYKIEIVRVLYEFNEPILFVAKIGMFYSLFLKTDENEQTQEFLSCYIDEKHVDGLIEGRLSIRGAFEAQADNYIVISDYNYHIVDERKATTRDLSNGRLPKANVGVFQRFGECPDVLQEKNAFLSVYFRGEGMSRERIQYSILMDLLGSVQTLVKNVVMPPDLRGLRSSTFDFWVGDPVLGSLMISIKEPTFDIKRLRQNKSRRNITSEQVRSGFTRHKDEFFAGVENILDVRDSRTQPEGHEIYSSIRHLLPSDETPYTSVTFTSQEDSDFKRVSIDRESADAVRASYDREEPNVTYRQGTIIELNAGSNTLLLKSSLGNITTCAFHPDTFSKLQTDEFFKIGAILGVKGRLTERIRRDYIDVIEVIKLSNKPNNI